MKAEAQRIAIAEVCGWTKVEWYEDNAGPPLLHGFPPPIVGTDSGSEWEWQQSRHSKHVPNYLSDLNAMHEALATLTEEDQSKFCWRLTEVVRRGKPVGTGVRHWDEINATASQLAEAFLLTIGKWVEVNAPASPETRPIR